MGVRAVASSSAGASTAGVAKCHVFALRGSLARPCFSKLTCSQPFGCEGVRMEDELAREIHRYSFEIVIKFDV